MLIFSTLRDFSCTMYGKQNVVQNLQGSFEGAEILKDCGRIMWEMGDRNAASAGGYSRSIPTG